MLEECTSIATTAEEGFAVYQSPLSLHQQQTHVQSHATVSSALENPVLAEKQQPPLACDPDLAEMLSVLGDSEVQLQPNAAYLEDQHGPRFLPQLYLDSSMRRTAASWLVEVAAEFGLHQETLFLGTALLDRFLSAAKGVPRTQLQLVAVACMLIAAKHEEELHPSMLDFTEIADNCFLPADLLRMEAIVLDCLSFRINTPTAHTFLSMYKQALSLQPRTCALASYLAELAILEYELLHMRPSHIAAAATLLAQLYTSDLQSTCHLAAVTQYSVDDLKPCMRRMLALQRLAHEAAGHTSPYLAVRDKYSSHQWLSVATTTPFSGLPSGLLAFQPTNTKGPKLG